MTNCWRETAELQQQHQHQHQQQQRHTNRERIRLNPIRISRKDYFMNTASSAVSGSGQQRAKRAAADAVPEADESAALPSAFAANTRRRIAEKSAPVAVITHEELTGTVTRQRGWRVLSKSNWETSWSCQSRVMCSYEQDNRTSRRNCRCEKKMDGT